MSGASRSTTIAVVVAALLSVPATALAWAPKEERAQRYIGGREGTISYTVIGPHGGRFAYEGFTKVPAASVIKVMFMAAYLRQGEVRDRDLDEADKDLLGPMIKRSDNAAATTIADDLGPEPINRLAKKAEMKRFSYTRPWGASTVTASDQAKFMWNLDRYIPERHEGYARYLLSHVTSSQRWGIGKIGHPNWKKFFKGGWGSGTGAVCHQVAFIERDDLRIAVAVMITDSPSHDYGKKTLRGVFERLLADLPKPSD